MGSLYTRTPSCTHRSRLARVGCTTIAALLLALALAACGAAARGRAAAAQPGCASAGEVAARTTALVARRIYELELDSAEVRADRRQIEGFAPLQAALSAGDRVAVARAVRSLVFSHTHVVRLRVSSTAGVLADVGGPFIIAPVAGTVRAHGRVLAHYLLSVQDDSGYAKLEQRFVGAPVVIRQGGRRLPVESTLPASAASLPADGRVSYHGGEYQVVTFAAQAFPTGTLSISLLVAAPATSSLSCGAVATAELMRIGRHAWQRFVAVGASPSAFVHSLGSLTGALAYVRAGATQLAGSSRPGPARLPAAGVVRYRGRSFAVTSFAAAIGGRAVRVYQLLPA